MDETFEVEIDDISKKGLGVGHFENAKVEIPHTFPGDVALAFLRKKRRGLRKGRVDKIIRPSPLRVDPMCPHAFLCGGCSWQMMKYEKQLEYKNKIVQDAFSEITYQSEIEVYPIKPCKDIWHYRNKMEFSFSENKAKTKFLGLMIARANRYVFNLEKCYLCSSWMSLCLRNIYKWWENSSILAYDTNTDTGTLRNLTLREGKNTNEKMITLLVSGNSEYALKKDQINSFVEVVKETLKGHKFSIFLRLQQIAKNHPTKFYEMHLYGPDTIEEEVRLEKRSLKFKISPSSFFQPNTHQAQVIYQQTLDLLDLKQTDIVYDLYCGTGTFGMAMSSFVKRVIAIELNPSAAIDAKENIKLNNITNMQVYTGDVKEVLQKLLSENYPSADCVVVDPPRAGLDKKAIENIFLLKPKKILYVSCNPYTQAENIKDFLQHGYRLKLLQPIDQFPHTPHVENIAVLEC